MKMLKAFNSSRTMLMMLMMVFTMSAVAPVVSMAQGPKISSLTEIEAQVSSASTSMGNMAKTIIGAVLFIALIGVIYMVASSHPKSKEGVIGWIVAVVVYIIAITII